MEHILLPSKSSRPCVSSLLSPSGLPPCGEYGLQSRRGEPQRGGESPGEGSVLGGCLGVFAAHSAPSRSLRLGLPPRTIPPCTSRPTAIPPAPAATEPP